MSGAIIGDIELSAWLDGEAPPDRREAIERWVRNSPDAALRVEQWRRQNDILRARFASLGAEAVPDALLPAGRAQGRFGRAASVAALSERDAPIQVERFDRRRRDQRHRLWLAAAGAFTAGVAAAYLALAALNRAPGFPAFTASAAKPLEALAGRALDANRAFVRDPGRPVEISGDSPARVNEFLSRRIGLEVNAPLLDGQGTRLLGARLTPGDFGPVGLMVYEDPDGERFGLLVSRIAGVEGSPFQIMERRSNALVLWAARGAAFALIGAADPARLLRLAKVIEARAPATALSAAAR